MYCTHCGSENADGSSFCGACGQQMSAGRSGPATPAPVPPANIPHPTSPAAPELIKATDASINRSSPQVNLRVWKTSGSLMNIVMAAVGGVFLIGMGLVTLPDLEGLPPYVMLGLGVFFLWLTRPIARRAKVDVAIGIDRATDTIWIQRGTERFRWYEGAAEITRLTFEKQKAGGSAFLMIMDETAVVTGGAEITWDLLAHNQEDGVLRVATFHKKKEAKQAQELLSRLLGRT